MSDFSLTLVLRFKTSKKIFNDMAKVQQKSEKITAFGGIFFVLDRFDRILSSVIDSHLGLRSKRDQGDRSLIFYFERGRDSGVKATSVFSSDWGTSIA